MNLNRMATLSVALTCVLAWGQGFATTNVGSKADGDGRTVFVAVDQQTLHAREVVVRTDHLIVQIRAALPSSRGINIKSDNTDTTVSVYVTDLAQNAAFLEQARRYISSRPQLVLSEHAAETYRITYSPDAIQKFGVDHAAQGANTIQGFLPYKLSMARDLGALENFVRYLRMPLEGIQIEDRPDGAVIRSQTAEQGLEAMNAIRRSSNGLYSISPVGDREWRVSLAPQSLDFIGPGRRGLMGALAGEYLRSEIRDPLDLDVQTTDTGVEADVVDPEQHSSYRQSLEKAFSGATDFRISEVPSRLLRISLPPGVTRGTTAEIGPSPPLIDVMGALGDIADPPTDISATDGGVAVRARDPAHNADRTASVRQALAGRSDLVVVPQADQSLLIRFTSDIPAVTAIGQDRLTQAVQARLRALELQPSSLSPMAGQSIALRFATAADAATFKRSLTNDFGLFIRMVDDGVSDKSSTPPSPGDERLPQRDGGYLWLRPEALITGDMIASASAGNDMNNQPDINFRLTDDGEKAFAAATGANIGRRFAIVLDGVVISAPVIQSQISGGSGEITGNFTAESARLLAQSMMTHKDDIPLKLVDSR